MKRVFKWTALLVAIPAALIALIVQTVRAGGGMGRGFDMGGFSPPATRPATRERGTAPATATAPANATAPSSTQAAGVTAALEASKGVALIEVTSIQEHDARPVDGNLTDVVLFKTIKSTGKIPTQIIITKEFGGRRIAPAPKPAGPLYPTPIVVGQRYWIIFNDTDSQKYQQGVVAWWPEKSVPAAVEASVAAPATAATQGK